MFYNIYIYPNFWITNPLLQLISKQMIHPCYKSIDVWQQVGEPKHFNYADTFNTNTYWKLSIYAN